MLIVTIYSINIYRDLTMALKTKKSKDKKEKKERIKAERQPLIWNPDDGVTWHDFAGLFISVFRFFWRILKVVFMPVFWIYAENVRMVRFIRAKGEDRPMTKEEREFVEAIPVIYSLTGLIGGLLLGFFIILEFEEAIKRFIESISLDFIVAFFQFIGSIIVGIYNIIVFIFQGIGSIIGWLADVLNQSPLVAFISLTVIGIVSILLWLFLTEKGVVSRVTGFLNRFFGWLIESPDLLRFNVQTWYRKFNHNVSARLIGEERMATRTQVYFKKSLFYTLIASLWAFSSGIYVGVSNDFEDQWAKVLFTSSVLFVAGIISGFIFLIFVARFIDSLNRKKYIAPQFIVEDVIDEEALKTETKRIIDSKPWLKDYVPKSKETSIDEEKPWKKEDKEE